MDLAGFRQPIEEEIMSVATICDRCHATRADGSVTPGWSKVTVQQVRLNAEPPAPPTPERSLDLCPSCSSALKTMLEPTKKAGKK